MDELDAAESKEAARLTSAFAGAVQGLEQGCRDRDLAQQKQGAKASREVLESYLALASVHYTVPKVR